MAKFDREICSENLVPQSLQILYIFVLRARVSTTFSWKVGFFPRVVQKIYEICKHLSPPPKKSRALSILRVINS